MVLFRALGWLLLGASVAVAVRDALYWWSEGAFHPLSLGGLWQQLDFSSLQSLESAVDRYLSALVWARLVAPVLRLPALPAFVLLGLFLLWYGQRREERPPSGFVLGPRPPRRRRRSSLS
ncbi:MAG TPA: hypothetical protein VKY24_18920 [Reyranella sp.]|jgi:hypothetical protein|nr:hypothetical protein [Reyranella sp.]